MFLKDPAKSGMKISELGDEDEWQNQQHGQKGDTQESPTRKMDP